MMDLKKKTLKQKKNSELQQQESFCIKNSTNSVSVSFQLNMIQQIYAGNREETLKNTQKVTETS